MARKRIPARSRALKVTIVGLKGDQFTEVGRLLAPYELKLCSLEPKNLLNRRKVSGRVIVLTRFTGHKHLAHAEQIAPGCVVWVAHGAATAIAEAIVEFLRLKKRAA